METILTGIGVVVVALSLASLIGGPMLLMDWLRSWREEATRRQIALTDAIDAELGAIVSPVVKKPLWAPWQIRIAVPFTRPAAVGRILAVAHEVLSAADRMNLGRYQIVLTPKQDSVREEREARGNQSTERWARDTRMAA
jgi:hypothetical protein